MLNFVKISPQKSNFNVSHTLSECIDTVLKGRSMSQVYAINQNPSVYNAVKIRIDNPQAYTPNAKFNNGEYNAVNIEVSEPELRPARKPVYSYPVNPEIITYDQTGISPVDVPMLPVAYKTSYTYINAELEPDKNKEIETVKVPEPQVTNTEDEKELAFHGLNFKAAPQVMAKADIKPDVNEKEVVKALESADFDQQAKQMEEIVTLVLKEDDGVKSYITTPIISALINILEKDTNGLEGPSDEQTEIRKKIILNEIAKAQQTAENKKPEEIKLPFEISEADFAKATKLNPIEMAERNKEYAIYTIASLAKIYADDYEKQTGNVVPLTDLPGVANIVETLKKSDNSSVKVTALETLLYLNRAEYKDEIGAIFEMAATDKNKAVSQMAMVGLGLMAGKLE